MRLNKYLAQCGVCSRRDADKLIEQGKVLVNGQVAGMGQQVEETDTVQVGKKILQGKQTQKVLAFYKPEEMQKILDEGLLFDFCPEVVKDSITILKEIF